MHTRDMTLTYPSSYVQGFCDESILLRTVKALRDAVRTNLDDRYSTRSLTTLGVRLGVRFSFCS